MRSRPNHEPPEERRRGFGHVVGFERRDDLIEPQVLAQAGEGVGEGGRWLGRPEGAPRRQGEPLSAFWWTYKVISEYRPNSSGAVRNTALS